MESKLLQGGGNVLKRTAEQVSASISKRFIRFISSNPYRVKAQTDPTTSLAVPLTQHFDRRPHSRSAAARLPSSSPSASMFKMCTHTRVRVWVWVCGALLVPVGKHQPARPVSAADCDRELERRVREQEDQQSGLCHASCGLTLC
jgi:hypothetical protein